MPIFVHIADEKNSAKIKRSGIAPSKQQKVVYFMPVVQEHFIAHQWLRELNRQGAKVMVGVYFRLKSSEIVWAGKYNTAHRQMLAGAAVREIETAEDPLGYEVFIERKIAPAEIVRIRHLPQKIGWRYMPNAHGKVPCACPRCLPKGAVGAAKIRQKFDPPSPQPSYQERLRLIADSSDIDVLTECLLAFRGKRRVVDPSFLAHLLELDDEFLLAELASALYYFKHPTSDQLLLTLIENDSEYVREAAQESLAKLSSSRLGSR